MLTVGTWTKMYFVDSKFEMDYLEKYLNEPLPDTTHTPPQTSTILDDDDTSIEDGILGSNKK